MAKLDTLLESAGRANLVVLALIEADLQCPSFIAGMQMVVEVVEEASEVEVGVDMTEGAEEMTGGVVVMMEDVIDMHQSKLLLQISLIGAVDSMSF